MTELSPAPVQPLSPAASRVLASTNNVQPAGTIDSASYVSQGQASVPVGTLNTSQVTGLLAQAAQVSGQSADAVTPAGVGKFALTPQQLESAGYLKPGTVQQYLSNPAQLQTVLSSPSVWTGRSGVDGLGSLLNDAKLQDTVQQEIMVTSLSELQKTGVITGNELPSELAPFVQVASKFGISAAESWSKGQAPADLVTSINSVAKGAQYAVNFVNEKIPPVLGSGARLGGFVDTVDRSSLDSVVGQIFNNPKIPVPNFSTNLYANTPDEDLVYRGDDEIVWDRINEERLKRGLPSLASIGIPRPGSEAQSGVNI